MGVRAYADFGEFFTPSKWRGTELHERAKEIRSLVPRGRILTLAPLHPLEAGLSIYPAFSTGPFAWRVSPYIEAAKAARLGIVSPATLEQTLSSAPPAAVLVVHEKAGEEVLSEYARQHGYALRHLGDKNELWVPGGH
jgi:hypothetical protein